MKDPLPTHALLVGHLIHKLCGEACITGSSPLTKYFWNLLKGNGKLSSNHQTIMKRIGSNDVDIFAPMNPTNLAKSRQLDEKKLAHMDKMELRKSRSRLISLSDKDFSFQDCDELLFQHCGYLITNHNSKEYDDFGIGDANYFPWNEAASAGIRCTHNFKLACTDTDVTFQLILIDAYPLPGETWHRFVTKRFDINIVTGYVEIKNDKSLGKLHFDSATLDLINCGLFHYVIKPCVPVKTIMKRISKYQNRGFRLVKLSFHSDCNKENKSLVLKYFHHIYDPTLCMQWFENAGINQMLASQVFDDYVSPYLHHLTPSWHQSFIEMQQQHFHNNYSHNDWICPSLVRYSKEVIESVMQQQTTTLARKKLRKWFKKALLRKVHAACTIQVWWKLILVKCRNKKARYFKKQKLSKYI